MRFLVLLALSFVIACDGAVDREDRFLVDAKSALEAGNLAQAEAASLKVLQINPNSFTASFNLGLIAERRNQWGQACGLYQRTYRDWPLHIGAALRLSRCLVLADRAEEALILAGLVAALHPDNHEAKLVQSAALLRLDRFREARATAATATGTTEENALIIMAASHRAEGNFDLARSLLRRAKREHTSFSALYRLDVLLRSEDFPLAHDQMRQIIRSHPKTRSPVVEAGLSYLTGRFDNAVRVISQTRATDPTDAIQLYELLELLSRDPRMAVLWTAEVLPKNANSSSQLWPVFLSLKRLSKLNLVDAERLAEQLLEADIDDGTAQIVRLQLANLRFVRGERESSTESVLRFAKGFIPPTGQDKHFNPWSLPKVLYPENRECSASLKSCVNALLERNIRALMLRTDPWLTYALDLAEMPESLRTFGQAPTDRRMAIVSTSSPDFPRFANEIVLSAIQQRASNTDFGWTNSEFGRRSKNVPYVIAAVLIGLVSMLIIGPISRTRRRIK